MRSEDIGGVRVLFVEREGTPVSTSEHATDLIGDAWSVEATVIAVPVARLDPEFFRLSSRVAGEIAQKVVNYHLRLAVIGDVSQWIDASDAFRDWVRESNRGEHVWFIADEAALEERLETRRG